MFVKIFPRVFTFYHNSVKLAMRRKISAENGCKDRYCLGFYYLRVWLTSRTPEREGRKGRKPLVNFSGCQVKLRCSQPEISGTETIRREILMISQLSVSDPSALRAAGSPEISGWLHLSFARASYECLPEVCAPSSPPDPAVCRLALKNRA